MPSSEDVYESLKVSLIQSDIDRISIPNNAIIQTLENQKGIVTESQDLVPAGSVNVEFNSELISHEQLSSLSPQPLRRLAG